MTHDRKERVYRLHVPEGLPKVEKVPLVVVFHGGGGNARQGSRIGFTAKADKEKFIAVYPEALNGNWNDGRTGELIRERAGDNDDVGFIMALIAKLRADHKIDPDKIYPW